MQTKRMQLSQFFQLGIQAELSWAFFVLHVTKVTVTHSAAFSCSLGYKKF